MKINYSKKRLYSNLVLGALFAILGGLEIYKGGANYFTYFQLLLGFLMVIIFFFQKKYQYLTIENGFLTKFGLRKKALQLDKIEQVQSFPGRIKIYTSENSLSINTSIVDEDLSHDLYRVLGSLNLKSRENPFVGWAQVNS